MSMKGSIVLGGKTSSVNLDRWGNKFGGYSVIHPYDLDLVGKQAQ